MGKGGCLVETLPGVEGMREACQPKAGWSAGSGRGANSPGARDDGLVLVGAKENQ